MKKCFNLSLLTVFLLCLFSSPGKGQTTKEIMEKMIEAQGGRKVLEGIKDTTLSGAMEMIQYGLSGPLTMYQKEPNKMRIDLEVMGMVVTQAFDGEMAWMTNPQTGSVDVMPERFTQEYKRQALGNDSFLNPEKYGISYELKGKEKIDDKDCFVLEQTFQDGFKVTLYVDSATFLIHKTKGKTLSQAGVEVLAETLFSDYRKIEETTVAHSLTVFHEGEEFMRMTITKVNYNSGLEDSLFKIAK